MKISQRPYRVIAWVCWCIPTAMSLYGAGCMLTDHALWWNYLLLLIFPLGGGLIAVPLLYFSPRLRLEDEGIYVKCWFATRFYSWSDFCQAGVDYFVNRGNCLDVLVLVKKGCSERKYQDRLYHLRNFGRLVYLPYIPETRSFIIAHYGLLDFNVAGGREEQSIVVEE